MRSHTFVLSVVALLAFGILTSPTHAQTLIFDNSAASNGTTSRGPGDGPAAIISNVSANTVISNIAILSSLSAAANLKFVIFDHTTTNLLYVSAPKAFSADAGNFTFKVSDPFSFTLLAGTQYDIGAISDGSVGYRFIFPSSGHTENGISTAANANSNLSNFAAPVDSPNSGSADIAIRLYAPAAVPEPGSIALLTGLSLTGAAFLRRRKNARKAA